MIGLPRSSLRLYMTIAALIACRVGGATAALVLSLLMTRIMSIEQMGLALTAMSVAVLGALVASGGLEGGGVRYLASYLAKGNMAAARGYLQFTTRGVWLIGTCAAILVVAALGAWAAASGSEPPWPLLLAVPSATMLGVTRVWASHALGFGRPLTSNLAPQLVRPLTLMAGMAALWGALGALDATQAMAVFVMAACVTLALQGIMIFPLRRLLGTGPADLTDRRAWLRIGLMLGVTGLFIEFGRDLAIVLAGFALPPEDIARFGIAIRLIGTVKFGLVAVNQSFMPQLAAAMARNDEHAIMHNIAISNHIKFWPMLLVSVLILSFREPIMELFGQNFLAAAPLLPILMIEPLALCLLGPGSSYITFSRAQHVLLPVTLVAIGLLAVGVIGGGRLAGMQGAAWGVALAWSFWSAALAWFCGRILHRDVTMIAAFRWLTNKG